MAFGFWHQQRVTGEAFRGLIVCSGLVMHVWLTITIMYTTLNMMFSVTYVLELRNIIIVYYACHFVPTKVESVVWKL